jgi:hypothetical protein
MDINECNVENGDCEQVCTNGDGEFTCSCYTGYVLHTDALSCVDVNECEVDNDGCQQQCVNTEGSYFCSCGVHFALKEDKLSCESEFFLQLRIVCYLSHTQNIVIKVYRKKMLNFM